MADLEALADEITFASNKIFLTFDRTPWRPTYYHVCDEYVAEQNRSQINALPLTKLFARCVYRHFADRRDVIWLDELPSTNPAAPGFARDCTAGVYGGFTVVYHQLQLAYHMGIREVYLIGLDYRFDVPGASTHRADEEGVIVSVGERNHFHPQYRQPGEKWTQPRLDEQREAFIAARAAFEDAGGRLLNASHRSRLDALERIKLDDVLAAS